MAPNAPTTEPAADPATSPQGTAELRRAALAALCTADPAAKAAAALALDPDGPLDTQLLLRPDAPLPGRPARPRLVPPADVPRRTPFTREGRAAQLHAVAHIELNAIDLALDAAWRFAGLPEAYYRDWARVAREEALHFTMLAAHLETLGRRYGDFDAHDGLWAMCEKTAGDPTARMALVPRTLEARGLDATPPMRERLVRAGDLQAASILDRILRDEIGHVAVGNRWYRWLCERDGLDPVAHYAVLVARHDAPQPKGPLNLEARRAAGFTDEELRAADAAARQRQAVRVGASAAGRGTGAAGGEAAAAGDVN
ncbi:MAG: ferritin-like domain-containing protein [Pseudomonadota bacterium]|nr:ferritin-like domain-containing protein [Rubrivivax sp.]